MIVSVVLGQSDQGPPMSGGRVNTAVSLETAYISLLCLASSLQKHGKVSELKTQYGEETVWRSSLGEIPYFYKLNCSKDGFPSGYTECQYKLVIKQIIAYLWT